MNIFINCLEFPPCSCNSKNKYTILQIKEDSNPNSEGTLFSPTIKIQKNKCEPE